MNKQLEALAEEIYFEVHDAVSHSDAIDRIKVIAQKWGEEQVGKDRKRITNLVSDPMDRLRIALSNLEQTVKEILKQK